MEPSRERRLREILAEAERTLEGLQPGQPLYRLYEKRRQQVTDILEGRVEDRSRERSLRWGVPEGEGPVECPDCGYTMRTEAPLASHRASLRCDVRSGRFFEAGWKRVVRPERFTKAWPDEHQRRGPVIAQRPDGRPDVYAYKRRVYLRSPRSGISLDEFLAAVLACAEGKTIEDAIGEVLKMPDPEIGEYAGRSSEEPMTFRYRTA